MLDCHGSRTIRSVGDRTNKIYAVAPAAFIQRQERAPASRALQLLQARSMVIRDCGSGKACAMRMPKYCRRLAEDVCRRACADARTVGTASHEWRPIVRKRRYGAEARAASPPSSLPPSSLPEPSHFTIAIATRCSDRHVPQPQERRRKRIGELSWQAR